MMFRSGVRSSILILVVLFALIPAVYGQTSPEATVEATPEATAEVEPCLVRTEEKDSARVRVGPGQNRGVVTFLAAQTDFTVLGQALDNQDALWYRLDKDEAAPGRLINEAWVAASEVTASGGCEGVNDVEAPPIIPFSTPSSSSSNEDTIIVPGSASTWVNSGVTIEAGQTVTIQASGRIDLWNTCDDLSRRRGLCSALVVGPGGFNPAPFPDYPLLNGAMPFPGGTYGALIGRIGSGQPFDIGSRLSLTAEQSGSLYLMVNDWEYPDNVGSFTVRVTIE